MKLFNFLKVFSSLSSIYNCYNHPLKYNNTPKPTPFNSRIAAGQSVKCIFDFFGLHSRIMTNLVAKVEKTHLLQNVAKYIPKFANFSYFFYCSFCENWKFDFSSIFWSNLWKYGYEYMCKGPISQVIQIFTTYFCEYVN